ncbi:expressed protein [Dictyostelium purpureum]|uniref:Expressed protein n=1 Tax=Dictyostelium purpureum TaxID=5786 RepID=F0ZWF9_DICPU|nr:uncharacterized protein DICPUDRAFT_99118 [Dictyostelium purpureum]EGC31716.1 expressed protein [Dictyostelium purpureum]|eukprot:XP_003291750.1 expressed protein [Dictyostelium purpureum]
MNIINNSHSIKNNNNYKKLSILSPLLINNHSYNNNNNNNINYNSNNNNNNSDNNDENKILPNLPIYLKKYIIKIICEHINNGSNISFNSFNNGSSFIKESNEILMNLSLVCKGFFDYISNHLNVYYLENNNNFNYNILLNNPNCSNNINSNKYKLFNNNINTFVINFNNSQNNSTNEINNMNNNNNGEILITNQTISNYHFIDYINEKIKNFRNLKKIKIISNSGCYYSKINGVDDLNRIIFLGEIKVYRIVLRSCLMSHSNRNRYQITIAEFMFKPNHGNNLIENNEVINIATEPENQINNNNNNNNNNNENINDNNNNNIIIPKPIHSFKIKKIIHEYTNSMMVKDLNLGLFIYSINKSKEQFVVRESFTSLTYPFEQPNNLFFSQQLLSKYYSYFIVMLILTISFIYYK